MHHHIEVNANNSGRWETAHFHTLFLHLPQSPCSWKYCVCNVLEWYLFPSIFHIVIGLEGWFNWYKIPEYMEIGKWNKKFSKWFVFKSRCLKSILTSNAIYSRCNTIFYLIQIFVLQMQHKPSRWWNVEIGLKVLYTISHFPTISTIKNADSPMTENFLA
jgi:hypothetical protein